MSRADEIGVLKARVRMLEVAVGMQAASDRNEIVSSPAREIARQAAELCGITYTQLMSSSRKREFAHARYAAVWTAHHVLNYGYTRLAIVIGRKDHSTAISALRSATQLRASSPEFADLTDYLFEQAELRRIIAGFQKAQNAHNASAAR